jgi:hypothetical protein
MKKLILALVFTQIFSNAFAQVSYEELQLVKEAIYKAFEEIKPSDEDFLSINEPIPGLPEDYWWSIEMVHASYVRVPSVDEESVTHKIYLMGGFVRLDGMTPDGLAVTACHEIGHGIGGDPKKNPSMGMPGSTTEGQSDYFSTKVCLPVVMKYLEQLRAISNNPYLAKLCGLQKKYKTELCKRMFTALESDMAFFDYLGTPVAFENYATEVALEINRDPSFYPSSQCRLDTMIHGLLGLERPMCWYPEGEENGIHRANL